MSPLALLGLGALGLGGYYLVASPNASAASSPMATNWPPTAAQQAVIQQQMSAMVQSMLGRSLTSTEQAAVANMVAQAPDEYAATGGALTASAYQQWAQAQLYQGAMLIAQGVSMYGNPSIGDQSQGPPITVSGATVGDWWDPFTWFDSSSATSSAPQGDYANMLYSGSSEAPPSISPIGGGNQLSPPADYAYYDQYYPSTDPYAGPPQDTPTETFQGTGLGQGLPGVANDSPTYYDPVAGAGWQNANLSGFVWWDPFTW